MVFVRTLWTKDRGAIVCEGHSTLAFIPRGALSGGLTDVKAFAVLYNVSLG